MAHLVDGGMCLLHDDHTSTVAARSCMRGGGGSESVKMPLFVTARHLTRRKDF